MQNRPLDLQKHSLRKLDFGLSIGRLRVFARLWHWLLLARSTSRIYRNLSRAPPQIFVPALLKWTFGMDRHRCLKMAPKRKAFADKALTAIAGRSRNKLRTLHPPHHHARGAGTSHESTRLGSFHSQASLLGIRPDGKLT